MRANVRGGTARDPLEEPVPVVDADLAAGVLRSAYGISGALRPLPGERDLNFDVRAASGERYVLKFVSPADPAEVVEMRVGAISHVRRVDPGLPVADLVPTADGGTGTRATGADGRVSQVQCYRFLPGHHAAREELGPDALAGLGRTAARLGRALRGYFHPAAAYSIPWDLRHAGELVGRLGLLAEPERSLAREALARFVSRAAPVVPSLRAQVVHNDLSRDNVLVDDSGSVVGILDFGDLTHTSLVFDLAIAIADVLDGRPGSVELAVPLVAGYSSLTPLEDDEAALLGDLVATRLAAAVVLGSWRRERHGAAPTYVDGAGRFLSLVAETGFDEFAAGLAGAARAARDRPGEPDAGRSPGAPGGRSLPRPPRDTASLGAARARVLGPLGLVYRTPVHLVRGEGAYLFGSDGRRYLDAYNNVPVVGHCHPRVAEAIAAQARVLVTNTRYLHESAVTLAERLLSCAPSGLDRVLFVSSGSEANDVAIRVARFATGADGLLATAHAYHGVTSATTDVSPEEWPAGTVAPPHVGLLDAPAPAGGDDRALAARHADEVLGGLASRGHRPAALLLDPALTSDGILGPAAAFVAGTVEAARRAGALLVADEVQAGFGRTGSMWSIDATGVSPDLVTLGKPMGNGFPVAALLARSEVVDEFISSTGYFSTFGGNTLACAAALAVLDVLEDEHLAARAAETGAYLRAAVDEVVARDPAPLAVRSFGLLLAIEVRAGDGPDATRPDAARAAAVANRMRELGVLVGTTGPSGNVVKVRPPLVFSRADAQLLAATLDQALAGA